MSPGQQGASPASQPTPPPAASAANGDSVVVPLRRPPVEAPAEQEQAAQSQSEPEPSPVPPPETLATGDWWAQLLQRLQLDGLLANLARHAVLRSRQEDVWHLVLDPGHEPMATEARIKALAEAISGYMDKPVRLQVSFETGGEDSPAQREERARQALLAKARETLRTDPVIKALVTEFDGRLDEDSIEPE